MDALYLISAVGPLPMDGNGIEMNQTTRRLLIDNGWIEPNKSEKDGEE